MQKLYYLAGLPRAGSTLLGTLLSQRPDTFVSATSGLIDVMGATVTAWENSHQTKGGESTDVLYNILKGIVQGKYQDQTKPVILDKSRGWASPIIQATMANVAGTPKIIAPVRPIAECLASFMKVAKWKGTTKDFVRGTELADHLFKSYQALKDGYETYPENILFVVYNDLLEDPQRECDRIAEFLGLEKFEHCLEGLVNPVPENDAEVWGIPDLHYVRPTVSKNEYDAKAILGEKDWLFYQGGNFWNGNEKEIEEAPTVLDLQRNASLRGDFDLGWELCQLAEEDDNRALFNKGWYLLRQGDLQAGMAHLDCGRPENVFGNAVPSAMPIWCGEPLHNKTILLNLEGGLGDQIHGSRFAIDLAELGAKVVLAGSPELASILSTIPGVSAFVESNAAGGVYHHYWVPSMSVVRPLQYEYKDIKGDAYISYPKTIKKSKRLRVGLRWSGNPQFEHEQHRRFDPTPLFNLKDVDLISLQKDSDIEIPDHVKKPKLDTWDDTLSVISGLDLVITSCTSVAHLSAAMGKPTWIIVPILPYYLWALPGNKTVWYDSVTLFRQDKFGDWTNALNEVTKELAKKTKVKSRSKK
jgi:hypothetical protein